MTTKTAGTETTHTRGPWDAVYDDEHGRWVIFCPDYLGRHIAYLSDGGVPEEEEPGNAHLIAAAPAMLDELKAAEDMLIGAMAHAPRICDLLMARITSIRAVIAAAQPTPRPRKITGKLAHLVDDMSRKA